MKKNYNFCKRHNYLAMLLLYFVVFIPIACIRFQDLRNEIKYFVVTEQLLTEKNIFVLKYFSDLYPDKPPLYFWILGLSKYISVTHFPTIAIILGSLVPSLITVIIFYRLILKLKNENIAFTGAFTLALLPMFTGLSVFLRMDMLMTMFITIALYIFFGFYYSWIEINRKWLTLFYLFIFMGLFTKGIAGIALPLLIPIVFLVFEVKLDFLKKIKLHLGLLFIVVLVLLWFVMIYISPNGKEYIMLMLGRETVGRIVSSKTHVKPFYYYLKVLPPMMFPYTIAIIWALVISFKNIKKWKEWEPITKIGFIWTVVPVLMFSAASGKLAVYLLPVFPGAILLIHSLLFNEKIKYREGILKICEILPVIPYLIGLIERKKRDFHSRINRINYSLVIIFCIALGGLHYFNNNYTVEPFLKLLRAHKVSMYNFSDGANLIYFTSYPIKLYGGSNEVAESSPKYLMTKAKYGKNLEKMKYELVFKNKQYALYVKKY
ncbi:ArnT family glycosyltransferase [Fusobacterium sp.]|uniref:ArnT family glycosyltransferase n=1 Tax=Fusobacterium sp. TaxID=68766 RepID=UPI00396C9E4C